jgi:hypothetical protein
VPLNLYKEDIPDDVCLRYGRLMNELQTVHKRAAFLDDARFIHNLRSGLKPVRAMPNTNNTHATL